MPEMPFDLERVDKIVRWLRANGITDPINTIMDDVSFGYGYIFYKYLNSSTGMIEARSVKQQVTFEEANSD